jgi:hypothetical protein
MAKLINTQNQVVNGPDDAASIQDALASGYKLATPENLKELENQQKFGEGVGNEVKAGALGAANAATFGAAAVGLDKTGVLPQEDQNQLTERNPIASGVGTAAGILGSSLALPGEGAVGAVRAGSEAIAEHVASALPETASKVLNYAKGVGTEALGSAIEGSAYGLGNSVAEGDLGDPQLNSEKIMANMGSGALIAGIIGGGVGSLKGLLPKTPVSLEEELSGQAATPGMNAQVDAVNGHIDTLKEHMPEWAPQLSNLQETLGGDTAIGLHTSLDNARDFISDLPSSSVEQEAAKQALSDNLTEHLGNADVWGDNVASLEAPKGEPGRQLLTKVVSSFTGVSKDALDLRLNNPEAFAAAPSPIEFAQKFKTTMEDTKQQLSDDSTASFNMVKNANLSVPLADITNPLKKAADALDARASSVNSGVAKDLYNQIAKLTTFADESGQINLTHAWEIKKDIQDEISSLFRGGRNHAGGILSDMRTEVQNVLKAKVPGYTEHMAELHADAKTFNELGNKFTNPKSIEAFAKRVGRGTENNTFEKQALAKFDARMGTNLSEEAKMVWAKDAFTRASTNGSRKTLMGGAIGRAVGHTIGLGPLGGAVGAGVGALFDTHGGEILDKMISKAEQLKAVENSINDTTNKISKAVKGIFSSTVKSTPAIGAAIGGKQMTSDEHGKLAGDLNHLTNNIETMSTHINGFTSPLYGAAPATTGALAGLSANTINFLASKLPQTKPTQLFGKPAPYSKMQLEKFGKYLNAVHKPLAVLDEIKSGAPSQEGVETLKTLMPTLYADVSSRILNEGAGQDIPYRTKLGVSKFLGMPVDESMQQPNIAAVQAVSQVAQAPQTPKPTQSGLAKLDVASRSGSAYGARNKRET